MKLREHQTKAVHLTFENNFASGVHFHATGTGKSWVALDILLRFTKKVFQNELDFIKKPKPLVILWLCEKKSILQEQFNNTQLKKKGYFDELKIFNIINFSENKCKTWYHGVNSARFWGKPLLVIINRAFLTSQDKYKQIKVPIHLVLHDECHSIKNTSSQEFYSWLYEKNNKEVRCIGFSATPCFDKSVKLNPFSNIISKFTIYDACILNDVILPPMIERVEVLSKNLKTKLENEDICLIVKNRIRNQPFKKIIVWAGMIDNCFHITKIWKKYFEDFSICVDVSCNQNDIQNEIQDIIHYNYDKFYKEENNSILFCASKHREGSDIPNVDTCVFLDFVEERTHSTFVQCVGRVLRRDSENKKKFGLIIDVKAKSTIKMCDRFVDAFQLPRGVFPWESNFEDIKIENSNFRIHQLYIKQNCEDSISKNNEEYSDEYNDISREDVCASFTRIVPNELSYKNRLNKELELFEEKNLYRYLFQAKDILIMAQQDAVGYIPHITRGSCGSSLVCYLMGLSHIDPVKYNISFARFLNNFRETLPDVDFDFPYNHREKIFAKLQKKWPGKIARISNHVHFHEKSARREALRRNGVSGFIGKFELYDKKLLKNLDEETIKKIDIDTQELMESFRCYSLHCGGIVYYENGIPESILMKEQNGKQRTIQQVTLDKHEVSDDKLFKIDILSSRGLAQLSSVFMVNNPDKILCFDTFPDTLDLKTQKLLESGKNIGITFAESPLMRKAFMKLKPKTVHDIAICLSIVRPAATQAKQADAIKDAQNYIIFDDDAIHEICKITNCSEDIADKYRRLLSKSDKKTREKAKEEMFEMYLNYTSDSHSKSKTLMKKKFKEVFSKLEGLHKYSFCKSHAYSYAQLVAYLAYYKVHEPLNFWKSTLKHCHSSYRKWVHLFEAQKAGFDMKEFHSYKERSIYAENKMNNKLNKHIQININVQTNQLYQLKQNGFFIIDDSSKFIKECYITNFIDDDNIQRVKFKGIIASSRVYRKTQFSAFLCVAYDIYIEVHFERTNLYKTITPQVIGLEGEGFYKLKNGVNIVQVDKRIKMKDF